MDSKEMKKVRRLCRSFVMEKDPTKKNAIQAQINNIYGQKLTPEVKKKYTERYKVNF